MLINIVVTLSGTDVDRDWKRELSAYCRSCVAEAISQAGCIELITYRFFYERDTLINNQTLVSIGTFVIPNTWSFDPESFENHIEKVFCGYNPSCMITQIECTTDRPDEKAEQSFS
ncbi:hypothetical protein [Leptolyngbya sp. AN10]|uniref:hypothetical protein n=1 Tax=Leptolyngbya sp. AN10 TaxID=3423365 RepID=UPI003D31B2DE